MAGVTTVLPGWMMDIRITSIVAVAPGAAIAAGRGRPAAGRAGGRRRVRGHRRVSTSKLADYLHLVPAGRMADLVKTLDLGSEALSWDDHLSAGPIPAKLSPVNFAHRRCLFGEAVGWGAYRERRRAMAARDAELARYRDYGEVVYWFGPGLDDQLALLQALDQFAVRGGQGTRLTLVPFRDGGDDTRPRDVADHPAHDLRARFERRRELSTDACRLSRRAWDAVRTGDPSIVEGLLGTDTTLLPDLAPALHRLLEELPDHETGLSRTEAAVLAAVGAGPLSFSDLLAAVRDREAVPFQTSATLHVVAGHLAGGPNPMITISGEDGAGMSAAVGSGAGADARMVELTDAGRSVQDRQTAWQGPDLPTRWVGGYQVGGDGRDWRWDAERAEVRDAGMV